MTTPNTAPGELKIELQRRSDGTSVLRCTRADGSVTWQHQRGTSAGFFPRHDLAHYAVETVLRRSNGFFGLIAAGWEIGETDGKSARGPLPAEAIEVESLVGLLDVERASGDVWSAEDFNRQAAAYASSRGAPEPMPVTETELQQIRSLRQKLSVHWSEVPSGGTLELRFPAEADRPWTAPRGTP